MRTNGWSTRSNRWAGQRKYWSISGAIRIEVAISNERILGMDEDSVSFRVRDSAHGNRRRTLRLPAQTFIDRFLLHILPKGLMRSSMLCGVDGGQRRWIQLCGADHSALSTVV